jgi:hypothetical protein
MIIGDASKLRINTIVVFFFTTQLDQYLGHMLSHVSLHVYLNRGLSQRLSQLLSESKVYRASKFCS